MASVYILYSSSLDRFYIGSCKDLSHRLVQHINKEFSTSFTSKADDWILYYSKDGLGYQQARSIENHIKTMKSRVYIRSLKAYPEMITKLMLKYP